MDRFREPVAALAHNLRPSRRKLQKNDPRTKNLALNRVTNESSRTSSDSHRGLMSSRQPPASPAVQSPSKSDCPDLSDPRWFGYIDHGRPPSSSIMRPSRQRNNHFPAPRAVDAMSPPPTPPSPAGLVPELTHLALCDRSPQSQGDAAFEEQKTPLHPTISVIRRQAKTPVFQIGQLEKSALRRRQAEAAAEANRRAAAEAEAEAAAVRKLGNERPTSTELIAEQYRSLLDFRDYDEIESTYTPASDASYLEKIPPLFYKPETQPSPPSQAATNKAETGYGVVELELPPVSNHTSLSPTSDDGTLVAFEEDIIYFKPISFSPQPSPPAHRQTFDEEETTMLAIKTTTPEGQSSPRADGTQAMCEKLLTQQLSTSLLDPSSQTSSVASSRQLQVMIRSYEKLQRQAAEVEGLSEEDRSDVAAAFGHWLAALRKVHQIRDGNAA
jgi:hypothetical protein